MRTALAALLAPLLASGLALPAAAQSVPAQRFDPAPWWMAQPVVASIGVVRFELRANRANIQASFQAIEPNAAAATQAAAGRVRALAESLRGYGAERVRVQTTVNIQPLYDQYRNRQGQIQENQRADQVERYAANATVDIEVRDMAVLERVYGAVLGARPTSVNQPYFNLVPSEAVRAALYGEAVEDAARRARRAAEAAGARLGAPKVIDPTGRACETDMLARGENRAANITATDLEEIVVTGSRISRGAVPPPPPAPPPPPPPVMEASGPAGSGASTGRGGQSEPVQLPLQPPIQELQSQACIVYALS